MRIGNNLNKINYDKYIYLPFVLFSKHLYRERKYVKNKRPYLIGYCNSNKVKKREELFNMFVKKTNQNMCKSMGKCYGNYPKTNKMVQFKSWNDDRLIEEYGKYKFIFALENGITKGYVTEKIMNVFISGAIPIYWGCDEINNYFNKEAFINVSDFNTLEECVDYVINMNNEQIKHMQSLSYLNKNNDIINLFNEDYGENKYLNNILQKVKTFLDNL